MINYNFRVIIYIRFRGRFVSICILKVITYSFKMINYITYISFKELTYILRCFTRILNMIIYSFEMTNYKLKMIT